jgi:hypothetical protein
MRKLPLAGWSFIVAVVALIVSTAAVGYTRKQYKLAYELHQRAIAVTKPKLGMFLEAMDQRHWNVRLTFMNRSDEPISPKALSIPSPPGGFISISQIEPVVLPASGVQMNSNFGLKSLAGHPVAPGDVGVWTGTFELSDAFPTKPGAALTVQMVITYPGSERTETLSTTRRLN